MLWCLQCHPESSFLTSMMSFLGGTVTSKMESITSITFTVVEESNLINLER